MAGDTPAFDPRIDGINRGIFGKNLWIGEQIGGSDLQSGGVMVTNNTLQSGPVVKLLIVIGLSLLVLMALKK